MKTLTTQKTIICMFGIEICLSNNSKSAVRFLQQREAFSVSNKKNEALFVWYVLVSYSRAIGKLEKLFLVS